jgi:hypothetical protein
MRDNVMYLYAVAVVLRSSSFLKMPSYFDAHRALLFFDFIDRLSDFFCSSQSWIDTVGRATRKYSVRGYEGRTDRILVAA